MVSHIFNASRLARGTASWYDAFMYMIVEGLAAAMLLVRPIYVRFVLGLWLEQLGARVSSSALCGQRRVANQGAGRCTSLHDR